MVGRVILRRVESGVLLLLLLPPPLMLSHDGHTSKHAVVAVVVYRHQTDIYIKPMFLETHVLVYVADRPTKLNLTPLEPPNPPYTNSK